jgi:hypothetical protein
MAVAKIFACLTLALVGLLPLRPAAAGEVDDAAALLSRYPSGSTPLHPRVVRAITSLAESGGPPEISLLRSLAAYERPEIRAAAALAITRIRVRQREGQRLAFAADLPDWPELQGAASVYRDDGLGREEAACAAYADLVLARELGAPTPVGGVVVPVEAAELLLAAGLPRKALAVAIADDGPAARMLEARAREDLGDLSGAIRGYAELAARGDAHARSELDDIGVDTERLLLGLLVSPVRAREVSSDAAVVDVLVLHGEDLTATVLAERTRSTSPSDRAVATEALGRMLVRPAPLAASGQRIARLALLAASQSGPEPLRLIALEALE